MQMPKTLKIRNGDKVQPTFSAQEYAARHARLRAYMAEQDIEAAIFTSYHNVNYYSDFLYCSFGRPYALVITQDKVVSISANIDGGQPWRRTVGTDNIVYTDWQRDNYFVAIQRRCRWPRASASNTTISTCRTTPSWPPATPKPSCWTLARRACACA